MSGTDGTPDFAVVAQGNMEHLRGVQGVLRKHGMQSRIIPPAEGCGSS